MNDFYGVTKLFVGLSSKNLLIKVFWFGDKGRL